MKKLYEVNRKFYVMAEDESEAENYTPMDSLCCSNEVWLATSVDSEWWNALPFNGDDDIPCKDLINPIG